MGKLLGICVGQFLKQSIKGLRSLPACYIVINRFGKKSVLTNCCTLLVYSTRRLYSLDERVVVRQRVDVSPGAVEPLLGHHPLDRDRSRVVLRPFLRPPGPAALGPSGRRVRVILLVGNRGRGEGGDGGGIGWRGGCSCCMFNEAVLMPIIYLKSLFVEGSVQASII